MQSSPRWKAAQAAYEYYTREMGGGPSWTDLHEDSQSLWWYLANVAQEAYETEAARQIAARR